MCLHTQVGSFILLLHFMVQKTVPHEGENHTVS